MKSSLVALLALCAVSSTGFAQTNTAGDWLYTVYSENGTDVAKLVGVSDSGVVNLGTTPIGFEVPEYLDGYPIRTIGAGALRRLAGLRVWDDIGFTGVTRVEADAFFGVTVKNLTFWSDTLHVDDFAFNTCQQLETIWTGSVTRIGNYAFRDAGSFRGFASLMGEWEGVVSIPPTVRAIGSYAFFGSGLPWELTIPSGVTTINDNTFFGASGPGRVILPDTVTSVRPNAFDMSGVRELLFKGSPPAEPFAFQGDWVGPRTIYRLPGASGWSNTFGGAPVKIFLEKATAIGMSPALGGFKFSWSESGGSFPVNVERAPSPAGPWTVVSTTNTNGQFTDLAPPSGSAFYRARTTIP